MNEREEEMMKPLGDTQLAVLKSLSREPYPGSWYWANRSTTIRVLDSLVKRGLASKTRANAATIGYDRYRITDAGRKAIEETS